MIDLEKCIVCQKNKDIIDEKQQNLLEEYIFNSDNPDITVNKNIIGINKNKYTFVINKKNVISKGAFGTIFKLYDKKYNVALALKLEHDKPKSGQEPLEKKISEFLNDKSCNVLKVKYIGEFKSLPIYLMELANGDLHKLKAFYEKCKGVKTLMFYRNIAEEIRIQMVCLLKKSNYEYVYTDIKLANILYRCIPEKNIIRILLGDLGSASPIINRNINKKYYIATYPPWEHREDNGYVYFDRNSKKNKEYTLSWMIGIILLSFIDTSLLNFLAFDNLSKNKKYGIILKKMETVYGKEFSLYLHPDPTKRLSIHKSLSVIEENRDEKTKENTKENSLINKILSFFVGGDITRK